MVVVAVTDHRRVGGPQADVVDDLLDETTVVAYAVGRGLVPATAVRGAERLSGGVSNVVLRVRADTGDVVVKQALGKLLVADDWFADRGRSRCEAAALRVLSDMTPDWVPRLLDDDAERSALAMVAAPSSWVTWKSLLLAGEADPALAGELGARLAVWHVGSRRVDLDGCPDGARFFRELRLEPYFHVSASRHPGVADAVLATAAEIEGRRTCLVLGDFSPKNILVEPGGPGLWAIDLEVAHRGDPTFDVAFLATHLLLKRLHVRAASRPLRRCLDAFLDRYAAGGGEVDGAHLRAVVGCLLLARVLGSSPVEYLTESDRATVVRAAERLLGPRTAADWRDEVPW